MKCLITKTSNIDYKLFEDFESLEDLKEFIVKNKKCVIRVPYDWEVDDDSVDLMLEIYDTWRE